MKITLEWIAYLLYTVSSKAYIELNIRINYYFIVEENIQRNEKLLILRMTVSYVTDSFQVQTIHWSYAPKDYFLLLRCFDIKQKL